jgi:hypothetical protein
VESVLTGVKINARTINLRVLPYTKEIQAILFDFSSPRSFTAMTFMKVVLFLLTTEFYPIMVTVYILTNYPTSIQEVTKEEAMSMDSIFGSVRFFAIALLLSGFGVGFLGMGCSESNAEDSSSAVNVVIMDCGETEGEDTFKVEDISSTDDVGIALDEDCAEALKKLLSAGYQIVPGGGGAVHDSAVNIEHVVYTLTSR